jgi:hypothetical protein
MASFWGETAATALPLASLSNACCTMATKKTQAPFFTRRRPNSRGWPQPSYAKNATLKQLSPVIALGGNNISSIDGLAIFLLSHASSAGGHSSASLAVNAFGAYFETYKKNRRNAGGRSVQEGNDRMSLLGLGYAVSLPDEAVQKESFLDRACRALHRARMAQVDRILAQHPVNAERAFVIAD